MRVLMASDQWFPDAAGGSARVATNLARELASRGHRVVAVAPTSPCLDNAADGQVVVHKVIRRGSVPRTLRDPIETYFAAKRDSEHFDVALAHQSTTSLGLASARPRLALVRVFHASAARELAFLGNDRPRSLRRNAFLRLLQQLDARSLRSAQRILVLSDYSRSLLEEDFPEYLEKVSRVSAGVDVQAFAPVESRTRVRAALGVAGDGPLILTVRRLEARMGIDGLLRAVSALREIRGLRLVIVGEGPLETPLRARAIELQLDKIVTFTGRVPDDRLRDWYRAADLFVLPTVAYEGFGMVTAEALACGTPVVGTPVGATPELLGPLDSQLLAASASPADLAAAMERVLTTGGLDLRRRCRAYAMKHFDWHHAINSWECVLSEVADSRKPACALA
jgi:glycosyltransferase involved in cell wall biosynthesis